jgi:hypothetical protein
MVGVAGVTPIERNHTRVTTGQGASAVLPALQAHRVKRVPLAEESPPKRALGPDLSSWIQRAIAV